MGADDREDRLAELERENAMLKAAIRACPAGILIASAPEGVIEFWNPAALGIRGAGDEELTRIPLEQHPSRWQTFGPDGRLFAPEDLPLARALLHGEVVEGADVIIRDDAGTERWVAGHAAPVKDADGEVIAGVVVFPDITARKNAELELERFRSIAEVSPDFIGIASAEGRAIYVNPAGRALCGLAEGDVPGRDVSRFHPPSLEPGTLKGRLEVAARDGLWEGESQLALADGTFMPAWQTLMSHRGPDGAVAYYSTFLRDMRPVRQLEEQLNRRHRLESVGRLAGGVAHDFNNLLTVILNNAEMVRSELPEEHEGRMDLEQVVLASQRAADLCRQLLSFARRQMIKPKPLALPEVVTELTRLFHRTLGEDILLHTDVPADTWPVLADPSQLDQILVNLVVNAREAMPNGGELTLAARNVEVAHGDHDDPEFTPGHYVKITVTDTGSGMTPEVLARAFEPFFTTKGPHHGSGLGLATAHGAVRQNKGHIRVQSKVGEGTTFEIYWPRSRTASARPSTPPRELAAGRGTVLVVEDEQVVRKLTVRLLQRAGFDVLSAEDGPSALDLAAAHEGTIDALVTDVVMPHMNGRQLAEQLKGCRPELQVLFVSGYTEDAVVQQGVIDEGVRFLSKPFTSSALIDAINGLLQHR